VLLKVANEDGSSTEWILTTPSLQALTRTGLSSSSIKVGELVKATVLPARNGNPAGFIRRLEAADRAFDLVID
jgi:outer membrane usher protein FimD/PapC